MRACIRRTTLKRHRFCFQSDGAGSVLQGRQLFIIKNNKINLNCHKVRVEGLFHVPSSLQEASNER